MFDALKLTRKNAELTKAFRRRLIFENSRRFFFVLLLVGLSQIVFVLLEGLGFWPYQTSILLSRIVITILCSVFMTLIFVLGHNVNSHRAMTALAIMTSLIQFISLLVGCYYVEKMFKSGIYSFSAFLLVVFVVSLTCVRNPYYAGIVLMAFFAGLASYLAWSVLDISVWIGEFLITLVFLVVLYLGSILNYERHFKLFLKESEVIKANMQLESMSQTDQLTGIYNRRKISQDIELAISSARRYGHCFCLAMLDIDHFKLINDQHNHVVGDRFLCAFTSLIRQMLRSTDVLGRWGGEEFLILIPNCTEAGAFAFIERLRTGVAEHVFDTVGQATFSAGICIYSGENSLTELIEKADQAMYLAKRSGRNQTRIYQPD